MTATNSLLHEEEKVLYFREEAEKFCLPYQRDLKASDFQYSLKQVYVPYYMVFDKRITTTAKVLYGVIHTFHDVLRFCQMSNEELGRLLKVSPSKVEQELNSLENTHYIKREVKYIKTPSGKSKKKQIDLQPMFASKEVFDYEEKSKDFTPPPSSLLEKVEADPSISAFAKLLYTRIFKSCQKQGYCWITNNIFGELLGRHPVTISQALRNLKKNKHVQVMHIVEQVHPEKGEVDVAFRATRRVIFVDSQNMERFLITKNIVKNVTNKVKGTKKQKQ